MGNFGIIKKNYNFVLERKRTAVKIVKYRPLIFYKTVKSWYRVLHMVQYGSRVGFVHYRVEW